MFSTVSLRGAASQAPSQSNSDYVQLLTQLKVLERENWSPTQCMPSGYGEVQVSELCQHFRLPTRSVIIAFRDFVETTAGDVPPAELRPLLNCSRLIPCSTAECERGFSLRNLIITPTRSKLLIERVSALMFIKLHGPPLTRWNPTPYVTTWLRCHHSAEDNRTCQAGAEHCKDPDPLWHFL